MVSARIEIKNTGNKRNKQYIIFYMVENHIPIPIVINNKMFYEKVIEVKQAIADNGGSNHIKKKILLGDITFQNGVFII